MTKPTRTISETSGGFWTDIDGDPDEQSPQSIVANRPSNFVAPARPTQVVEQRTNQVQQFDLSTMPIMHTSHAVDQSDELTRARGFVWRVAPLSLAFAATVGGIVLLGGGAWWALPASFAVFAVVWSIAFVIHLQRSPAGVAWFQARSVWDVVKTEQRYRHQVDWHERNRK